MLDQAFNAISSTFGQVQQALFEAAVQPAVYALGMGNLLEDAYTATGWLLGGLLQLLILVGVVAYFAILSGPEAYARFRVPVMPALALLAGLVIGERRSESALMARRLKAAATTRP